jgi:aminoglycoside phosphotransferase family enzyme/predicted kinase
MTSLPSQEMIFEFLFDPQTHHIAGPVKRIDTHGACIFLAGDLAYKVKRAIRYPYMDFSTLEKRKAACENEVAINRANAPDLYLGTVPITSDHAGLQIGGTGNVVEWAVHMRRFDEEATLDRLAENRHLGSEIIDELAAVVSTAHRNAPPRDGAQGAISLHNVILETVTELASRDDIFLPDTARSLSTGLSATYRKNMELIFRRGLKGKVRRCHGDLHLGNIVLQNGRPVLFDGLEFDENLAAIDTLYDLAFLVMDLCERQLHAHACRLLNRYLWLSDDETSEIEGLALLPLFLSLRAAIRAKVLASQSQLTAESGALRSMAGKYAEAALQYLLPNPPRLIAIGGLSGCGKSTLATALAPHFGAAPGALHLRSDIERKRMFGAAELSRLSAEAYISIVSAKVYSNLDTLAGAALRAGRNVIVDATFQLNMERQNISRTAARLGAAFSGVWLEAPIETLKLRVTERENDASDSTAEVVSAQALQDTGPIVWPKLDATRSASKVATEALALLGAVH